MSTRILLIQGPNMSHLGRRQPELYGTTSAAQLDALLLAHAKTHKYALDIMCRRVESRVAFGKKLSEQSSIRQDIAKSRCEIQQARLLTLWAADRLDREGNKSAKDAIAMIKVTVPRMCQEVADRAMQAHGGMGVCHDTPIPEIFSYARAIRLADGPDEVHMSQLGKLTIQQTLAG